MAVVLATVPLKYLILLAFYEAYTRETPQRKGGSGLGVRRVRDWWYNVPAAPVNVIKKEDKKTK